MMSRGRAVALLLTVFAVVGAGCDKPKPASCTDDGQCGAGYVCHTAVLDGVCATPCNALSMEAADGGLSAAQEFCRASMGNDADDNSGVVWSCGKESGRCFRLNSCSADDDCDGTLICHDQARGVSADVGTCLPPCSGPEDCPAGTTCDTGTHKCGAGCETDPTVCMDGTLCQLQLGTPAPCTEPCAPGGMGGFNCASKGEYKCNTMTGFCEPGCDEDAACGMGKLCQLVAAGAMTNRCFAPCQDPPLSGDCSLFDGNGVKYMCSMDGHCVEM